MPYGCTSHRQEQRRRERERRQRALAEERRLRALKRAAMEQVWFTYVVLLQFVIRYETDADVNPKLTLLVARAGA